jgi:ABC-type phosphate transport system permease subunit
MSNVIFLSASFSDMEKNAFAILMVGFICISVVASLTESVISKVREQQRLNRGGVTVTQFKTTVSTNSDIFNDHPLPTNPNSTEYFK